ncbi:PLP-dependent aminotransferase family protein [Intrasporangium sp. YIM S08009]|uniref:MocR-like pyridoxine biosynthesis transcription factor PdxR n=1 Tax=Intrasporangium zincisolvens TaxID=3080018 RepID=UPI002B05BEC3|nr:PLP-dependent aminotransferase family protein [Intrasporangium sp. YIM S08009]
MAVEWSSSAPELLLTIDRDVSVPLRSQLEMQVRDAIRNGRLAAGERLPSSRALAGHLGISRGIVQECYEQLVAEGYLVSRPGSATRVAVVSTITVDRPARQTAVPPPSLVADFEAGVPDLRLVPRQDWAWAVREACRTAPASAFDYGDVLGEATLREVLAAYLRRVRAADASAERIMVCAGYQQGLTVVLQTLAATGRRLVAVEDPGSVGTVTAAARAAHGECVPVPVDDEGIDVEALDRTGARVVVVTPAHQWPTGVVLTPGRRHDLLAWARRLDAVIVEDEYDSEFRYDREPVGSLQGLDPHRVVAIGTVSKSLAPALRLGWVILPPWLVDPVAAVRRTVDRGTPTLDQLALAVLVESGRYDRHLRRMRAEYARRREALVAAIDAHAPEIRLTGLAAGFHAVAHLPEGSPEERVVARARERGVGVHGMSRYRSTGATTPGQLVIGFGNTGTRAIAEGIATIRSWL